MRDHYAGDISDFLKFSLLRALAKNDKRLGIAWYFVEGMDKAEDGRHLEWRHDANWQSFDPALHAWLVKLPRLVRALEDESFWPVGTCFYGASVPNKQLREAWCSDKRRKLADANLIFLDPDNGLGRSTKKHATLEEVRALRCRGRAVGFITFPHRNSKHLDQIKKLHEQLEQETGTKSPRTLRTCISLPSKSKGQSIPRARWFTFIDLDSTLDERLIRFAEAIRLLPNITAYID